MKKQQRDVFCRVIAFLLTFALCFSGVTFRTFAYDESSVESEFLTLDEDLPASPVTTPEALVPSDDDDLKDNGFGGEGLGSMQLPIAPITTSFALRLSAGGTSYYFSSTNGSVNGDGSIGSPWNNLSKLDDIILAPGDSVLLERGSIFSGALKIQGEGTLGNEITIGAYGSGNKPIINGTGENNSNISGTGKDMRATLGNPVPNAPIYLYNAAYVTVQDIEVTNITPGLTVAGSDVGVGNFLAGVFVENNDAGTLRGIKLKDLYVHDVTGLVEGTNVSKMTGGIGFAVTGVSAKPEKPRFEDVTIEGCVIERVNSTGIFFDGYFDWGSGNTSVNQFYGTTSDGAAGDGGFPSNFRPTGDPSEANTPKTVLGSSEKLSWNQMKWSNVIVRDNLVTDTGKNAMIIRLTDETCVVEKNVVHNISYRAGSGNSIMSRTVYGTTFRYNEAYDNREHHDLDGSGFDADFYSPATVWEYNYTHDNNFGLITFCTVASDKDIVVRYNVSQNDRGRILNLNYNFINTQIYNNLFYIGKDVVPAHPEWNVTGYTKNIPVIYETHTRSGANYTGTLDYKFYNNIVYSDNNYVYNFISKDGKRNNGSTGVVINRDIDYNIFYGIGAKPESDIESGIGVNNIYLDPKVIFPGKAPGKRTLNGTNKTAFDMNAFKAMFDGYKLRSDSPAIGAGKSIAGMPSTDILGSTISTTTPDIGPIQFQGGTTPVMFDNGTAYRLSGSAPNYLLDENFLKQGVTINGSTNLTGLTITPSTLSTRSLGVQHITYSYGGVDYRRNFNIVDSVLDTRTVTPTQDLFLHSADTAGGVLNGTTNLALKNASATACRIIYYTLELSSDDVNKIKASDFNKGVFSLVLGSVTGTAGTDTSTLGLFISDQPVTLFNGMKWADQPTSNGLSPGAAGSAAAKTYYDAFKVSHPWYSGTFKDAAGIEEIPFSGSNGKRLYADLTNALKSKVQGVSGSLTLTLIVAVMSQSSTNPNNSVYSINSTSTSNKPYLTLTNGAAGLDNNANLKTLKVMDGSTEIAISPSLSTSVTAYNAIVSNEASSVTVTSIQDTTKTPAEPQVVKVNGTVVPQDSNNTITANLNVGKNEIIIKTTAEDWDVHKEYTLVIERLPQGVKMVYPTKTTYVDGGSATTAYDNAADMLLKLPTGTNTARASYLTFDAPTKKAEKVELQLFVSGTNGGAVKLDVGVFEVLDWSKGINWNTQPVMLENGSTSSAVFGDLTAGNRDMGYITQFYADSAVSQYNIDITDYYNSKVGQSGTFSLRLVALTTSNSSNGIKLNSINTLNPMLRPRVYVSEGSGTPTDNKTDSTFKVLEGFQVASGAIGGALPVFQEFNPPNVYAGSVKDTAESVSIIPQIPVGAKAILYRVNGSQKTEIKDYYRVGIEMGLNEFEMEVTAVNGVTKEIFVLQLERSENGGGSGGNDQTEIPVDTRPYAPINPEIYLQEQFPTVNVTSDIKFATVKDYKQRETDLFLDIYRGDGIIGNDRPVIVFVHGGGFRDDSVKTQGYIVEMATRFAKLGYVTVSIDYRLRKGSDMPTTADEAPAMLDASEDLNRAINWLRENASQYNFDPNYIFTAGGSAGGRTVVGYAYAKPERNFNFNGHIASAVLWGTPENEFDANYELKPGIPTYVLHGDADPTISIEYARRFASRLEEAGVTKGTTDFFYKEAPGGVHSLTGYPDRYNFIVSGVNRFFVENLKKALPYNEISVVATPGGSVAPLEAVYGSGYVVNVSATADTGYEFTGWTATSGTFVDASALQTSFTLPNTTTRNIVTVTANFSSPEEPGDGDNGGDNGEGDGNGGDSGDGDNGDGDVDNGDGDNGGDDGNPEDGETDETPGGTPDNNPSTPSNPPSDSPNSTTPNDSSHNNQPTQTHLVEMPLAKDEIAEKVDVKVSNKADGTSIAKIDTARIKEAIEHVTSDLKGSSKKPVIVIELELPKDAKSLEVSMPVEAVSMLAKADKFSLTLESSLVSLHFNDKALSTIASQLTSEIIFKASIIDKQTLSPEDRTKVSDRPAFEFSVTDGKKNVSDFGAGGKATVGLPYTLSKGENPNNIVIYYITPYGKLETIKNCKYDAKSGVVIFTTNHFSKFAIAHNDASSSFTDIKNSPYIGGIEFVTARGIFNGTSKTTFSPDIQLTRAMLVALICNLSGGDTTGLKSEYIDVPSGSWYEGYIAWAKTNGIAQGVGGNMFEPDALVTREQVAVMLNNYLKLKHETLIVEERNLETSTIAPWAREAVSTLHGAGLMKSVNGDFAPKYVMNREETALVFTEVISALVH